jgi:hypothetical protein
MNATPAGPAPSLGGERGVAAACWLVALLALVPRFTEFLVRVPRDNNEGWNAVWADRLARGLPIYFPPDSLLANNYPPLSFHLLALFPDPLLAGRFIAFAALLLTAAGVGLLAKKLGGAGWVSAGLLLAFEAAHQSGYVGMNDPQWLAHAIMTTGLVVLVLGRRAPGCIVAAAVLMLTAGLVKHILLPLPLAVTWWLWRNDRAGFRWWLLAAAAGLAIALAWLRWRHGAESFANIFIDTRGYSIADGLRSVVRWSAAGLPLLLVGAAGLRAAGTPLASLVGVYFAASAVLAVALIGGDGVDRNVYFDVAIAASLAAGWAFRVARPIVRWGWTALALTPLVIQLPMRWAETGALVRQADSWAQDIAWLAAQPAPVAAQELGLVHWSGHTAETDNFLLGQRATQGRLSLERLRAAEFNVWQLRPARDWPLPPGPAQEALLAGYRVGRRSPNGIFYVRESRGPERTPEPPPGATPAQNSPTPPARGAR